MKNRQLSAFIIGITTITIPIISSGAGFLSHDQVLQTCQTQRKIADQLMQARQDGTPKSDLEDKAAKLPVIAGETGMMLLNRVYQEPRVKKPMREHETEIFAAKVYRECNDKRGT